MEIKSLYFDSGKFDKKPFDNIEEADNALFKHEDSYNFQLKNGCKDSDFSPAWHEHRKWIESEIKRLLPAHEAIDIKAIESNVINSNFVEVKQPPQYTFKKQQPIRVEVKHYTGAYRNVNQFPENKRINNNFSENSWTPSFFDVFMCGIVICLICLFLKGCAQ